MRNMIAVTAIAAGLAIGGAGMLSAQPSFVPPAGYSLSEKGTVTGDQLKGVGLYSSSDEEIGKIADVELGVDGAATNIIVDVGGFLGIGAKPVALDLSEIAVYKHENGDLRAYTHLTKEQLTALPEYHTPK
ncbi:PRC-barrel domain-containing protein [Paenirhodobacter populi]|nr:PRC-barrel domain-containing protein [Sinirhodobacter populi]